MPTDATLDLCELDLCELDASLSGVTPPPDGGGTDGGSGNGWGFLGDEAGLPGDLAAAVEAALLADPAVASLATGGVFNGMAKDGSDAGQRPHIVFRVPSATQGLITSDSYWDEGRVRVEAYSASSDVSNAIIAAVVASPGPLTGVSLSFRTGVCVPLVIANRSQSPERGRSRGSARVYLSSVDYQARSRLGRPGG